MNLIMKIIILIVIVGLMGLGFWIFDYQGKYNQIESKQQLLNNKKQELESLRYMEKMQAEWIKAKKDFGVLLNSIQKKVPLKEFVPSFLEDIEKLVQEERERMADDSFKLLSITPGIASPITPTKETKKEGKKEGEKEATPASRITGQRAVFQLKMEGKLFTFVDFLQQLGQFRLKKLVTIQKIKLNPKSKEKGGSPVISIDIPLEAFMFGEGGG